MFGLNYKLFKAVSIKLPVLLNILVWNTTSTYYLRKKILFYLFKYWWKGPCPIRPWNWQRLWWRNSNDSISFFLDLINDHLTILLYVNFLLFSSHSSIPKVFCLYWFRSTFYHNTVRVLPLGAQNLGTQSSRVPKGNTQKNPKFLTLWVPNPKIPMEFRHKPTPTHTQNVVWVRVLPLGTRILGTQSPP